MNVVFLDYDGVVNTPMWDNDGKHCRFNFPSDNKVNNFQCVQWLSEFCEKFNYCIVVTSTWRMDENYIDCLKNGGLRDGIEIVGKTPVINGAHRGAEIRAFLDAHHEITNFIIIDDEDDMDDLVDHLILCDTNTGFGCSKFFEARELHEKLSSRLYNNRTQISELIMDCVLVDDDTPNGGTAFAGETVRDFILSTDKDITDLEDLNAALKECGIKPLRI